MRTPGHKRVEAGKKSIVPAGRLEVGKCEPPASQAFLEVFDGSDAQFETGGEGSGLGNTIALERKEIYEPALFGQENFELELELMAFDEGFLA